MNNIKNINFKKEDNNFKDVSIEVSNIKGRVLARLLSKKLSQEEVQQVSGGAKADTVHKGIPDYTA